MLVPDRHHPGPPTFRQVVAARFDPTRKAEFDAFDLWAQHLAPAERARWMVRNTATTLKDRWLDRGCGDANSRGAARAMATAARLSSDAKGALALWDRILRVERDTKEKEREQRVQSNRPARHDSLARELARRAALDQLWRISATEQIPDDAGNEVFFWKTWPRLCRIDQDNLRFLKRLVATRGWPTVSAVGAEASRNAWLLIQHADTDPHFQNDVLKALERLVPLHEVDGKSFAMLFDRVALSQNRPQRYATQFGAGPGGCLAARPVEDAGKVEELRAQVGLSTLREYAGKLSKAYGQPACADLFNTADPLAR